MLKFKSRHRQYLMCSLSKRMHKLKQCKNLIIHDENYYKSLAVSALIHKMGGGEGGALIFNFGR